MCNVQDNKGSPSLLNPQPKTLGGETAGASRAYTPMELAQLETNAAGNLESWLRNYLTFPTPQNFDGLVDRMRDYQGAWMNGRRRVL